MRFILFVAVFLIHQLPCVAGNKCLRALIVADTHTISTAVSAEIDTSLMKKCMHVISERNWISTATQSIAARRLYTSQYQEVVLVLTRSLW